MNPSDDWILEHLPSSCPELAIDWIKESGLDLNDLNYQHFRNILNRKMKSMERYGIVRWNYQTMPKTGAKIWVRI